MAYRRGPGLGDSIAPTYVLDPSDPLGVAQMATCPAGYILTGNSCAVDPNYDPNAATTAAAEATAIMTPPIPVMTATPPSATPAPLPPLTLPKPNITPILLALALASGQQAPTPAPAASEGTSFVDGVKAVAPYAAAAVAVGLAGKVVLDAYKKWMR